MAKKISMAPKGKHQASSSSATTTPIAPGGSTPQEAPISGEKWLRHFLNSKGFCVPLTSLKFNNHETHVLIYEHDSCIDEQNVDFA